MFGLDCRALADCPAPVASVVPSSGKRRASFGWIDLFSRSAKEFFRTGR
jgi:hypothetical protein